MANNNPNSVGADSTEDLIRKLQAAHKPSRAPSENDLVAWRRELEGRALSMEAIVRASSSTAAQLREKIQAIDVLLSQAADRKQEGSPTAAASAGRPPESKPGTGPLLDLNPDDPPDLRHTRVLAAQFAGESAAGWNDLVHSAHREAVARLGSAAAVHSVSKSNLISGRPGAEETKRGYRYVPEINISIQNVDAAHAWSNTLRLARHVGAEVKVDFEWMTKSDAAFPGQKGRLAWKPR